MILWEDFEKVDLKIGTLLETVEFPEAERPSYKLKIDLGELSVKKSNTQINITFL